MVTGTAPAVKGFIESHITRSYKSNAKPSATQNALFRSVQTKSIEFNAKMRDSVPKLGEPKCYKLFFRHAST